MKKQGKKNPQRWAKHIRNWDKIKKVQLNPENHRKFFKKSLYSSIMRLGFSRTSEEFSNSRKVDSSAVKKRL